MPKLAPWDIREDGPHPTQYCAVRFPLPPSCHAVVTQSFFQPKHTSAEILLPLCILPRGEDYCMFLEMYPFQKKIFLFNKYLVKSWG